MLLVGSGWYGMGVEGFFVVRQLLFANIVFLACVWEPALRLLTFPVLCPGPPGMLYIFFFLLLFTSGLLLVFGMDRFLAPKFCSRGRKCSISGS